MSRNILKMIESSHDFDFASVLTDDDILTKNSLVEIFDTLLFACSRSIGTVWTPRYCYLDNGSFFYKDCVIPFLKYYTIQNGFLNGLIFSRYGFILTGMFFKPNCSTAIWKDNIQNGYFPVLFFFTQLITSRSLYLDRNWFSHTVLNVVHWESWGNSKAKQDLKLAKDFLEVYKVMFSYILHNLSFSRLFLLPVYTFVFFILYALQFYRTIRRVGFLKSVFLSLT